MSAQPIASPATVLIILGAVTAVFSVPLLLRRVRPNCYYGIRIAAAFRSERDWYAINAFGARRFILFGVTVAAMGLILNTLPAAPFWLPIAGLLLALLLLLLTVRSIRRYAATLHFPNER